MKSFSCPHTPSILHGVLMAWWPVTNMMSWNKSFALMVWKSYNKQYEGMSTIIQGYLQHVCQKFEDFMSKNNDSWIFQNFLYFLSQNFDFWNFDVLKNSTFKNIIQLVLKLSRCYGDCNELSFLYFWLNLRHLCLHKIFCWWGCLATFVALQYY